MATPDLRSLYEVYRQIYGSLGSPPMPAESGAPAYSQPQAPTVTPQPQIPKTNGDYAQGGGVFGGWSPDPATGPQWGQNFPLMGPLPNGWRPPMTFGRFGGALGQAAMGVSAGLPFALGGTAETPRMRVPDIHIPDAARDAVTAAQLFPWTVWRRMHGESKPDGMTEGRADIPSSRPPLGEPPNGSGPPSLGILGLLIEEARRLQSTLVHNEQGSSDEADPDVRELRRVPSDSDGVGGSGAEASRKRSRVKSPPLVPNQVPPGNEAYSSSGGSTGGGGGGGSTGGGEENQDGCDEERRVAEQDCLDAMTGRKGRTNLGPWAKRPGKRFNFDDCVRGQLSKRCGGNQL